MKTLEMTGKIGLVGVNSSSVVHRQRIVEEIDFFDDQKPKRLFLLPQRKGHVQEILFPEILMIRSCPINISLTKKRALDDHQQSADHDDQIFKKRKIIDDSEIKSVGVNIIISGINDDDDHHKIVQEKSKMVIDEQQVPVNSANLKNKKKERCSKKRIYNPRNNNSAVLHIQEPQHPNDHIAPVPSLLHPWLLRHIQLNGGSQPQLLFEKKLEKSDVEEGLGRLFVTRSEKLLDALTEEERRVVLDEESKRGSRVYTIDQEGITYELFLKRWPSLKIMVLNHHWRKLCSANRLEKGDIVRGWGYRQSSEFRLALNFIRKDHAI